ncbi:NAD-dependent epimerase/dehydratase family protein [Ferruginibacter sp. SUN002]|uniref:NAD-dependent epimerase/dehydratase family protein n=1 Tax=Ferruginibacter sp. SUN002 TaxID=2937789 RepID=UPI003D36F158
MVLVTGGSGLVGKELISQLLAEGKDVVALFNKTPLADFNSPHLTQHQCDILDVIRLEEIMQGIEQVYHCAAVVTFEQGQKNHLFKINVEGTANIVNAALNNGVKKLIHVSSVAALGKTRNGKSIDETMNWTEETSNSNYSKSKYLSELEVWRGSGEGLDAVVVNPTIILGAGNWKSGSSQIFKSIYNEFPWYSEGVNGFVDVRDVAKAMIRLMESDISGQRFILNAENRSYKDIFGLIASGFGKKAPHKKVTPLLAKIVWRLEAIRSFFTGKKPLVTKETATTGLAISNFSNVKLFKYLPDFKYRSIEETIIDTCDAFKKRLGNE